MRHLNIFLILCFAAITSSLLYSQQKESGFIYKYNDIVPDGYYMNKPFEHSYMKTSFGIPDTSIVKIELLDVKDSAVYSAVLRLAGGNYYIDLQQIASDIKSGIYNLVLNAELDRTTSTFHMNFSGKLKMVIVK